MDLDCELDDELVRSGYARAIVNRVNRHRKEIGLHVADRIAVSFDGDTELLDAAGQHSEYIMKETLATTFERDEWLKGHVDTEIDGRTFRFRVSKAKYR